MQPTPAYSSNDTVPLLTGPALQWDVVIVMGKEVDLAGHAFSLPVSAL